jgi:hypothetical protein
MPARPRDGGQPQVVNSCQPYREWRLTVGGDAARGHGSRRWPEAGPTRPVRLRSSSSARGGCAQALLRRALRTRAGRCRVFSPWSLARSGTDGSVSPEARWGGWGSNPRPADYEKYGPAHHTHHLHGYHEAAPLMAVIALFAPLALSTNRSTPRHGDHRMPATERYRRPRLDLPGLRQTGDVVDLDYLLFLIDRVEDAVPPGPQAPQIRRPVRERLRRPRLIGELADSVLEHRDTDGIVAEVARRLV